jgi:hypothetical protein
MLLTQPALFPFALAAAVMLGLLVLELVGALLSLQPSHWLDHGLNFAPDSAWLTWLHLGRLPALFVLVLFLLGFALTGYGLQSLCWQFKHSFLPALAALPPAVMGGALSVRWLGAGLAKLLPKDESSAVSEASFIGQIATLTQPPRDDLAGQAKWQDAQGRWHYFLVRCDTPLQAGQPVLLLEKQGGAFLVNPFTNVINRNPQRRPPCWN